jgi:hypothetical protein
MTEDFLFSSVDLAGQMFSRAVLDTSRTRIRTFGSDDAGHLVGGRFRQVTLDDSRLALVVGVIAPQLFITTQGRRVFEKGARG